MRQRSSYPKLFNAQVVEECLERSISLFAGSLRCGKRAAAIHESDRLGTNEWA